MNEPRPRISELVVVEGLHDKQAVDCAVEADVWIVGGDRVANRFLDELARAAKYRGVIVLTDPDGAGERIRSRIASRIPACKQAVVAKRDACSRWGVGVEYASPEVIRAALLQARPSQTEAALPPVFTLADLSAAGLAGHADAAARRQALGDALGIGYANAKAFVRKLNVLGVTREEWQAALHVIDQEAST